MLSSRFLLAIVVCALALATVSAEIEVTGRSLHLGHQHLVYKRIEGNACTGTVLQTAKVDSGDCLLQDDSTQVKFTCSAPDTNATAVATVTRYTTLNDTTCALTHSNTTSGKPLACFVVDSNPTESYIIDCIGTEASANLIAPNTMLLALVAAFVALLARS